MATNEPLSMLDDSRLFIRSEPSGRISLGEYLVEVKARPSIAETAHQRICRMILAEGLEDESGHPYPFFSRSLFGIDDAIRRLVEDYFLPSARGFDVRRRILLLVGPVGGGKSTMVTLIKRGLERFSRTSEGQAYAISGCPMHEEPLNLWPLPVRRELAKDLGLDLLTDATLCPHCQWRLEHEYQGRLDGFEVERLWFSEAHRRGVGTYAPSDPKSQDISELTGSIDFAEIGRVGTESDPRAFRFDGELNIANRGLVEFQEMLKLDERFLYHLLSLSQEGNFKTGRYQLISADEVIVGHTNEHEFRTFKKNPKNQALLSRMLVVPVPYNLDVRQEVRIYQKLLRTHAQNELHISDKGLEMAATMAVLSRFHDEPRQGGDRLSKLERHRQGLHDDGPVTDGFDGLDPRYIMNRLAKAIVRAKDCVDASDAISALVSGASHDPFADSQWREGVEECASMAEDLLDAEIEAEVRRAFLAEGQDQLESLFQNYCAALAVSVCDVARPEDRPGAERLLRQIETRLEVADSQKHQFREEMYTALEHGSKHLAAVAPTLRRALEAKLFDDLRDALHFSGPDGKALEWIERAVEHMVATGSYCPRCATKAIRRLAAVFRA